MWHTPALNAFQGVIFNEKSHMYLSMVIPVIAMIAVNFCAGIFLLFAFENMSRVAKWCLKLYLFIDPQAVLQSKTVLKILSNDFSRDENDKESEKGKQYEVLTSHLLETALFMTNEGQIISCNGSVSNVLGYDPESIIGKNFKEILISVPGSEGSLNSFLAIYESAMMSLRPPQIISEIDYLRGNDNVRLRLALSAVSLDGYVQNTCINFEGLAFITLIFTDLTPEIAARTWLHEERQKGDNLLRMILPDTIVVKLQNGDKNISFAVQSASIMFVDIVSFTPWCGSLPAQTVMSTLNKLFAVFDKILVKYDKLLKIKCIGDCYMTAGGIFDVVNNPAEHTKQMISFGVDIIQALGLFNVENGTTLKIRAGMNCGCPITAGVLGIEKPTFDILGPAISMAAAMEHNGVPMNVHIPQHAYDLVYEENFRFKERGDIEIKGKMIPTFLVTGYK